MVWKDWDAILRDISSGEDSDAGDSLNVMSVQKNARRLTEVMHSTIPGLDPAESRTPPMGMNTSARLRSEFSKNAAEVCASVPIRTDDTVPEPIPGPIRTDDTVPEPIAEPIRTDDTVPEPIAEPIRTDDTVPELIPEPIRTAPNVL